MLSPLSAIVLRIGKSLTGRYTFRSFLNGHGLRHDSELDEVALSWMGRGKHITNLIPDTSEFLLTMDFTRTTTFMLEIYYSFHSPVRVFKCFRG